jgi:hypothetical protein
MAGLDRKVLNSRRITKIMAPSNPVFSRSFITSFDVASYRRGGTLAGQHSASSLFITKNGALFGHLSEIVYICTDKTKNNQDNEGIFI